MPLEPAEAKAVPSPTQEWVLWTHKCGKHLSDNDWATHMQESSHFFASPASKTTAHSQGICNLDHLPFPSRNFFLKGQHTRAPQTHVEYSVFRKGVFPRWEDSQCHGEWYTKHYFPAHVLDNYWRSLVQAVMAGQISNSECVAGIRVVDKSHAKHPCYRLEIWLTAAGAVPKIRDRIRHEIMQCFTMDPQYAFKFHWRKFETETTVTADDNENTSSTPAGTPSDIPDNEQQVNNRSTTPPDTAGSKTLVLPTVAALVQ